MARRKESDSAPGDIQAQIIAGRDGKPAYAVVPFDAFMALSAFARKAVEASSGSFRRTKYAVRENEDLARSARALSKVLYVGGTSSPLGNFLESVLSDKNMEKTFAEVSDWLLSGRNSATHPTGNGEEDEDVAAYDAARARDEESFPEEVAARLIAGENPVKVFREYREWTQQELAGKTGTTAPYLSQIETGRRTGSVKLLHRLADALRVELDDLV